MIFAIVVFPHPGGPKNIIELSLSAFIALYKNLSLLKICSCPTIESKESGLNLEANGASSFSLTSFI